MLNLEKFKTLHYKSKGTELYVEMSLKQTWKAGASIAKGGIEFSPNILTEEVFSMPKKGGVNGIFSSTIPLNYGGNLIDNFKLTFKEGKKVEFTAEIGYEILKNLLETDQRAKYLGEIALIPVDFMVGSENLSIDGIDEDRNLIPIFRNGNWVM